MNVCNTLRGPLCGNTSGFKIQPYLKFAFSGAGADPSVGGWAGEGSWFKTQRQTKGGSCAGSTGVAGTPSWHCRGALKQGTNAQTGP